jgi:hypothetical protein
MSLTAQFSCDIFVTLERGSSHAGALRAGVNRDAAQKATKTATKKRKLRGKLRMKKFCIATAIAIFAATTAPAFASCDTRAEDDQAVCASKCEDAYLKDQQSITANMGALKATRKACDEKCGCPQNSKNL